MSTSKIEELQAQEKELLRQLDELRGRVHMLRCDESNVHSGDLITQTSRGRTETYKVTKITFYGWGKPGLEGRKLLKDGLSFHIRDQYIGTNWEKVAQPEAPLLSK